MRISSNQKKICIISLVTLAALVLPMYSAHADLFGIGSFAQGAVLDFINISFQYVFTLVGKLIAVSATALNYSINLRAGGDIPVVAATWKILRDFANMIFIVLLIYMAFATIFDQGNYTFKSMIVRFVIVAILINFSLVLGNIVIDFSQVLTNIFLGSIGNIGDRLGQFLNPSLLLPSKINATDLAGGGLISVIFALIMALIFLFSLLTALAFSIIRVPYIWGLLIVSPVAWMAHTLPGTKKWFNEWWSNFLGWNLFLPVYLFFMYLGLLFLSKRDEIMSAVVQVNPAGGPSPVNQPLLGLTGTLTFNLLFFYIFTAFVMVGGLWAAKKVTSLMGSGFDQGVKWARTATGKITGYDVRKAAIQGAATAKLGEFQQQGFRTPWLNKIYGGKDADERIKARYGQRLGVRGADLKLQKEFVDVAGRDYQDFERLFNDGKITVSQISQNALKYKATDPRGFAYRKLAAKVGQLDNNIFMSTLTELSDNPYAAQDFVKTAKEGKFSKMKGGDLARMASAAKGVDTKTGVAYDYSSLESNIGARREMYRYVQTDKKAISGLDNKQLQAGLDLFGGHTTADGKAYLKEMGKVSPDFIAEYNLNHPDLRTEAEEGFEKAYSVAPTNDFQLKAHMLAGSLKSGDLKDTAGINIRVWNIPEFQEALKVYLGRLSNKARTTYIHRLEKALLDTVNGDKKIEILYKKVLGPTYSTAGATRTATPPTTPTAPL